MNTDIFSIFSDIYLFFKDKKHEKNIKTQEKNDGKKRTFKKNYLKPSIIINVIAFVIILLIFVGYFAYKHHVINNRKTISEINAITKQLEFWKTHYGNYPNTLSDLIGNTPTQKHWDKDAWGMPYQYKIINLKDSVLIISAGKDKQIGTKDDVFLK